MNKTLIAVVLDASSSMDHMKGETISALNRFIEEQKAGPGEAVFTLVKFDTRYKFLREGVPLKDVKPITVDEYAPGGMTALLDAMGRTIDETGQHLSNAPEAARPDRVIMVVMTDGHENSSHEYKREQVMQKVKHQTEKYGWQFLFLGAGPDAIAQAADLGVAPMAAMSYNAAEPGGTEAAYASVNAAVLRGRSPGAVSMSWSPEERAANAPKGGR